MKWLIAFILSQAIKSTSLSCVVFTLTLNNTLSRSTSIWSSRNSAISNVSLTAAPGSIRAHCIHLHPSSKELPVLFVFTSETWIYVSDKLRICFLFLLLSSKRDCITCCRVLKIYLKITHTNQNEKTTLFTNFWPLHCFWVPHHQLERLLHILCQRSESVSWHYLYILPSFHIFHLKLQILFTRGSLCLLKPKPLCFLSKLYSWHSATSFWSFRVYFWWNDSHHADTFAVWHRVQTFT